VRVGRFDERARAENMPRYSSRWTIIRISTAQFSSVQFSTVCVKSSISNKGFNSKAAG
jgi:hypothetical protein